MVPATAFTSFHSLTSYDSWLLTIYWLFCWALHNGAELYRKRHLGQYMALTAPETAYGRLITQTLFLNFRASLYSCKIKLIFLATQTKLKTARSEWFCIWSRLFCLKRSLFSSQNCSLISFTKRINYLIFILQLAMLVLSSISFLTYRNSFIYIYRCHRSESLGKYFILNREF